MKKEIIFKRVYANHNKSGNNSAKQKLVCIPLSSTIEEGDYVKITKVDFDDLPGDIQKKIISRESKS